MWSAGAAGQSLGPEVEWGRAVSVAELGQVDTRYAWDREGADFIVGYAPPGGRYSVLRVTAALAASRIVELPFRAEHIRCIEGTCLAIGTEPTAQFVRFRATGGLIDAAPRALGLSAARVFLERSGRDWVLTSDQIISRFDPVSGTRTGTVDLGGRVTDLYCTSTGCSVVLESPNRFRTLNPDFSTASESPLPPPPGQEILESTGTAQSLWGSPHSCLGATCLGQLTWTSVGRPVHGITDLSTIHMGSPQGDPSA